MMIDDDADRSRRVDIHFELKTKMTILSGILRIATGHIIHIHPDTEQEVQREENG